MPVHVSGLLLVVTLVAIYYGFRCFELVVHRRTPNCECAGRVGKRVQDLNRRIANLETILGNNERSLDR